MPPVPYGVGALCVRVCVRAHVFLFCPVFLGLLFSLCDSQMAAIIDQPLSPYPLCSVTVSSLWANYGGLQRLWSSSVLPCV